MTLTLEVSPETVQRVERAKSQGANLDTLLCTALEEWFNTAALAESAMPAVSVAGKYEGEAWDDLLTEIEKNRQPEIETNLKGG